MTNPVTTIQVTPEPEEYRLMGNFACVSKGSSEINAVFRIKQRAVEYLKDGNYCPGSFVLDLDTGRKSDFVPYPKA